MDFIFAQELEHPDHAGWTWLNLVELGGTWFSWYFIFNMIRSTSITRWKYFSYWLCVFQISCTAAWRPTAGCLQWFTGKLLCWPHFLLMVGFTGDFQQRVFKRVYLASNLYLDSEMRRVAIEYQATIDFSLNFVRKSRKLAHNDNMTLPPHPGSTGTIASYNYAGGVHLANQEYTNCIRYTSFDIYNIGWQMM